MDSVYKKQMPVYLILAGVLFLILTCSINIGVIYPAYEMATGTKDPHWEFQYNTVDLYYGAECSGVLVGEDGLKTVASIDWSGYRLDLFHDVAGYVLLIAGLLGLKKNWKRNRAYIETDHMTGKKKQVNPDVILFCAMATAVTGIVMQVLIFLFPFFLNGAALCFTVFYVGITAFFVQILTLYALTYAIVTRFWECSYRRDRFALMMGWFVIFVLKVVVAVCAWSHVPVMKILYSIILFGALVFYVGRIFIRREDLVAGE